MNRLEYDKIFEECRVISVLKNNLYGDENIIRYGIKGVFIRIQDKISRINNILFKSKKDILSDEALEDTFQDLINYSNYAIMLLRKKYVGDLDGEGNKIRSQDGDNKTR